MFAINEDLSIYVTRGDVVFFKLTAQDHGENYTFRAGDVVRLTVYKKKDCHCVELQKDFPVLEDAESVEIFLEEKETRIGELVSKPVDYWYEVELNPLTAPQTIIGYDENGAKVFRLFPEGEKVLDPEPETEPEDIPVVDGELDLLSPRPVENRVIAAAIIRIDERSKNTLEQVEEARAKLEADMAENQESIDRFIDDHLEDKNNPHNVTKEQLGLGNVPNVATNDQRPTYTEAEELAEPESGETMGTAFGKLKKAVATLISHIGSKNNPHAVTAAQVGARDNTWMPSASEVGAAPASHVDDTSNPHRVTAEQVGARPDSWMPSASDIGAASAGVLEDHVGNKSNPHGVTATQVGARPDSWTPTAAEVGARSSTWMPTANEVGARPNSWMPTSQDVGAVAIKKVWENEDTSKGFAAQTVAVNLADYDHVAILFRSESSNSNPVFFNTGNIPKGLRGCMHWLTPSGNRAHRMFTANDDGIEFEAGQYSGNDTSNLWCVPAIIYGIKGVKA